MELTERSVVRESKGLKKGAKMPYQPLRLPKTHDRGLIDAHMKRESRIRPGRGFLSPLRGKNGQKQAFQDPVCAVFSLQFSVLSLFKVTVPTVQTNMCICGTHIPLLITGRPLHEGMESIDACRFGATPRFPCINTGFL